MKKETNKYVTCKRCKWVHFTVTRKHAIAEVNRFNAYYHSLPVKEQMELYSGRISSIRTYERCMLCGACYHNFKRSKKSDLPIGSTVSPIIRKQD